MEGVLNETFGSDTPPHIGFLQFLSRAEKMLLKNRGAVKDSNPRGLIKRDVDILCKAWDLSAEDKKNKHLNLTSVNIASKAIPNPRGPPKAGELSHKQKSLLLKKNWMLEIHRRGLIYHNRAARGSSPKQDEAGPSDETALPCRQTLGLSPEIQSYTSMTGVDRQEELHVDRPGSAAVGRRSSSEALQENLDTNRVEENAAAHAERHEETIETRRNRPNDKPTERYRAGNIDSGTSDTRKKQSQERSIVRSHVAEDLLGVSGGGSSSSTLEKHVESDKTSDHQPQAELEKLQMQKGKDESPVHENAALATPIDWAISWDTETIFPEREIGEGQTKTLFDLERRPMTSETVKIHSINTENHYTHEEFAEVDFKRGNEAWLARKASGKFK